MFSNATVFFFLMSYLNFIKKSYAWVTSCQNPWSDMNWFQNWFEGSLIYMSLRNQWILVKKKKSFYYENEHIHKNVLISYLIGVEFPSVVETILKFSKSQNFIVLKIQKKTFTYNRRWSLKLRRHYTVRVRVLYTTFNNISVISGSQFYWWRKLEVPGESHWPAASHWQTLSCNVVSSTPETLHV
jgi:hypothetical protein